MILFPFLEIVVVIVHPICAVRAGTGAFRSVFAVCALHITVADGAEMIFNPSVGWQIAAVYSFAKTPFFAITVFNCILTIFAFF